MSDLNTRFAKAQEDATTLAHRPDTNTMLRLYGLYKQATLGDVTGDTPGPFDFTKRAKHDAWSAVKGTTKEDAMKQYIELVKSLQD